MGKLLSDLSSHTYLTPDKVWNNYLKAPKKEQRQTYTRKESTLGTTRDKCVSPPTTFYLFSVFFKAFGRRTGSSLHHVEWLKLTFTSMKNQNQMTSTGTTTAAGIWWEIPERAPNSFFKLWSNFRHEQSKLQKVQLKLKMWRDS